jgi:primary-amine oxidase
MSRPHPLHSITAEEITKASTLLKAILRERHGPDFKFRFKNVSIQEPPKALLLPYLDAEAAGVDTRYRPFVPRCADIVWTSSHERMLCQSTISLDSFTEVGRIQAAPGQHSSLDRSVPQYHLVKAFHNVNVNKHEEMKCANQHAEY